MSHITVVNQNQTCEAHVTIDQLTVKNADFFSVVAGESSESQEQTVLDVIAVGSAAMLRVRTSIDVDFVEKRFGTLTHVFDKALAQFEKRTTDALSQRFSPSESGSYTKQIGDFIAEAKKDAQSCAKDLEAKAMTLLDPERKTSATAKLSELVQQASSRFEQMFNPDLRTSYAHQLNERLLQLFGADGRAGALQAALQEALRPVFIGLSEVKERIEAKKAAEQVIEASTLKGKPFEELIHSDLCLLARPYGDDVLLVASGSNGSRAGDFLVSFAGIRKTMVVEARNRKQMSLPAIKADLDREIKERAADLAICVSSGPEMLPQHVGCFQIYGNKIVVTADNLHIAYRLARVLAAADAPEGCMDVSGLRSLLAKISDAARSLRSIKGKATQVKKFAEDINFEANGTEDLILGLVHEAEKLLELPALAQSA